MAIIDTPGVEDACGSLKHIQVERETYFIFNLLPILFLHCNESSMTLSTRVSYPEKQPVDMQVQQAVSTKTCSRYDLHTKGHDQHLKYLLIRIIQQYTATGLLVTFLQDNSQHAHYQRVYQTELVGSSLSRLAKH